jgi:hypothetical protein
MSSEVYLCPVEIDHAPFAVHAGFVGFQLIDFRFPVDFGFPTLFNALGQLLVLNQQQLGIELFLEGQS